MDDRLEKLYHENWQHITRLLHDYSGLEIASVLSAQAMTIYKTIMSEEDYQEVVEAIYDSRNKVQALEGPTLQ